MNFSSLRAALQGVSAYRILTNTTVFYDVMSLLDGLHHQEGETALEAYCDLFDALCQEGFDGIGSWLWDVLRFEESPYALLAEGVRQGRPGLQVLPCLE